MADEVIGEAEPAKKPRRSGRQVARGKDGLFDVVGSELIERVIQGELGVRRARRVGWIAKQLGLHYPKSVTRWRRKKARPELAQALALQALFPWIPIAAWLTAEERQIVQAAQTMGQIIAAEPAPNPKTSRKKNKPDPRQVTLEEMITMKTPPPKPKAPAAAPPPPVVLDEPDLGDWDPSFDGGMGDEAGAEP
jgi:hypothetical protein